MSGSTETTFGQAIMILGGVQCVVIPGLLVWSGCGASTYTRL